MVTDYFSLAVDLCDKAWGGQSVARDVTHAIWPDQPAHRLVRALCGRLVLLIETVSEPTCPACQAALQQYEQLEI